VQSVERRKKKRAKLETEARGGRDGVLPCYTGVQFSSDSLHTFKYERK